LQNTVIPALRNVAQSVAGAIEWFGQLPEGVQTAAAVVATALGAAGPMLMAVGTALRILGSLAFIFSPAGAIAVAIAAGIAIWVRWGDEIIQIVTEAFQWLSDTFNGFVDTVTEFAQNVRDGFVQAGEWIRESFNGLVEWFQELPMRFLEFGRNIITGLWDGLRAAWDEFSILDTVRGWGSSIAGSFASVLGIESPSRVFYEFGQNIGQGLHDGITSTFGMVASAVDGLSTSVVGGALGMARDVVGAMGQMFQGSKPIAMAMALINTFQGITEALKLPFPASLAAVARVAAQGFAAVQGIQNTRPGSTGGGAGAAGAASAGASAAPAEMPTQTLRFDFGGQNAMGMEQIVDLLNQAHDRGYRIRAVMA
jgi:phage-related protein